MKVGRGNKMKKALRKIVSVVCAITIVFTGLAFTPSKVSASGTPVPNATETKVGAWGLYAAYEAWAGYAKMSYESSGSQLGQTKMYIDNSPFGNYNRVSYGMYARLAKYLSSKALTPDETYKIKITADINYNGEGEWLDPDAGSNYRNGKNVLIVNIQGTEFKLKVKNPGQDVEITTDETFDYDALMETYGEGEYIKDADDVYIYLAGLNTGTDITIKSVDFVVDNDGWVPVPNQDPAAGATEYTNVGALSLLAMRNPSLGHYGQLKTKKLVETETGKLNDYAVKVKNPGWTDYSKTGEGRSSWSASVRLKNYCADYGLVEGEPYTGVLKVRTNQVTDTDRKGRPKTLMVVVDGTMYEAPLTSTTELNEIPITEFEYSGDNPDIDIDLDGLEPGTEIVLESFEFTRNSTIDWTPVPNEESVRVGKWELFARFGDTMEEGQWGRLSYAKAPGVDGELENMGDTLIKVRSSSGWHDAWATLAILPNFLEDKELEVGHKYKPVITYSSTKATGTTDSGDSKTVLFFVSGQYLEFPLEAVSKKTVTLDEFTYTTENSERPYDVGFNLDMVEAGTILRFSKIEFVEVDEETTETPTMEEVTTTAPVEPTTEIPTEEPTVEPTTTSSPTTTTAQTTTITPTTNENNDLGYSLSPWTFWQTGATTDVWNRWELCAFESVEMRDNAEQICAFPDSTPDMNPRIYTNENWFWHPSIATHQTGGEAEVEVRGISHGYVADIENNGWTAKWDANDNNGAYLSDNAPYAVRAWNNVTVDNPNKNYRFKFNAYIEDGAQMAGESTDSGLSPIINSENKYARLIVFNQDCTKVLMQKDIDITKQSSVYEIDVPLKDYYVENGETISTVRVEMQYGAFLLTGPVIKHKEVNWSGKIHIEDCEIVEKDESETEESTTEISTEGSTTPSSSSNVPYSNWTFTQGGVFADPNHAQETEWGNVYFFNKITMQGTGEILDQWNHPEHPSGFAPQSSTDQMITAAQPSNGFVMDIDRSGWDCNWGTGHNDDSCNPWGFLGTTQAGINLNHRYRVTFKAKADSSKYGYLDFSTNVDGHSITPWDGEGGYSMDEEVDNPKQYFEVTPTERTYTYTFCNRVGGSELTAEFRFGTFMVNQDGKAYGYNGEDISDIVKHSDNGWSGNITVSDFTIEDLDPEKPTAEPQSTTDPETQAPTQGPTDEPTTVPEPTTSSNPDIDALREQVNQLSESLSQHIENYNTQISTLEAQLAQLQSELEDGDEALSGRIDELNTQLTDIRNQIVDINLAMEELENDVANNSTSIGELQSDMESVLDDLSTVDNRIEDAKTEVENTVKAYVDDQVEELSGEINTINNSINGLIALIGVVPEGTNLQSEIVDIQNSVQAIEDELDSVDLDQIDKNKQQISTLQSQLLSITNTIAQNLLTETQNRINDTSRLTNTIDTINNSLKAKDVELQTQIDTLNSQLQTANADIQSINEQVVEIQGDIAANATNISKNASDIQSLVEQLSAAVAELNTVDNRIQTAKDDTLTLAQTYTDQKIAELNAEFENRMKEQDDDFTNKYNEQKEEIDRLNKEILGLKMSSGSTSVRLSYASKSSVNLNWNKHPYASGYEVYVMKPGKSSYELVADVKSQAFSYSIAMNLSYKFMVKAYMNDEKSASKVYGLDSNAVSANAVTPGRVVLKKVKAGKKKCTVQWNVVPKAVGYQIYYKQKKAKTITVKANQLSQVIKKLKKKKKVTVKVRAFVTYGVNTLYGAWSNTKKVKIK